MKLMNEIESDFDGKVAEIYVEKRTGSRVWTASCSGLHKIQGISL